MSCINLLCHRNNPFLGFVNIFLDELLVKDIGMKIGKVADPVGTFQDLGIVGTIIQDPLQRNSSLVSSFVRVTSITSS